MIDVDVDVVDGRRARHPRARITRARMINKGSDAVPGNETTPCPATSCPDDVWGQMHVTLGLMQLVQCDIEDVQFA